MTPLLRTDTADLDPLSEALGNCAFQCKLFEQLELSSPWGIQVPDGIVAFYAVRSGHGRVAIERLGIETPFSDGDVLVLPQSFAHMVQDAAGSSTVPIEELLGSASNHGGEAVGGGPGSTKLLACHLTLPRHCSYLVRLALPPVIRVANCESHKVPGLEETLRLMLGEVKARRPGTQGIIDRLAQVVFIHAVRAFMSESPGIDSRWPSALLNPSIAMSLTLIHQSPDKPWTVASLAAAVVMSRSAFADRFTELVGVSPIQYLTERRMHAACQLLHDPDIGLAQIAARVGYRSTAAFSHAFRRWTGLTPGMYRRTANNGAAHAPDGPHLGNRPHVGNGLPRHRTALSAGYVMGRDGANATHGETLRL
jgi:AraC-like DNA-binding protein